MNGWRIILKQMYNSLLKDFPEKNLTKQQNFPFVMGCETFQIQCDFIGKLIFKSGSYTCIRFLEEILEVDFIYNLDFII